MIIAQAQSKTGHPNCRRPVKVIDPGQPWSEGSLRGDQL